ncbi:alpha/beta fold hydrolase [Nocardia miyunensis]|uniref:alpha/beta fold hydrolase n=1 Tax=Nocardia miyunensis TaxID=282684 RepID=UPI001470872C|nr:alpha/beta hydrolase [Nocardia miyunensis]
MRKFENVDVGGYILSACVRAGDDPMPVVHINARGTAQDQWDLVLPRLYLHTTVTYDRPGLGESAPLPPPLAEQPRTLGALADELHRLLDVLLLESPRVIVGHSVGALIALMYAARHPAHTAGLVLVDCTTFEHFAANHWPPREGDDGHPGSSLLDTPGSVAELDTAVLPPVPAAALASAPGRWARLTATDVAEFAPLTPQELDDRWQQGQRLIAEKLGALLVVADFAGHHIPIEQPELVSACITAVATAARSSVPVSIPPEQLRYAGGTCPAR